MTDAATTPAPSPLLPAGKAAVPSLALRPREAAKALGVSERTLWTLTKRGEIPHLRLGRAVIYPVETLKLWLARQSGAEGGGV